MSSPVEAADVTIGLETFGDLPTINNGEIATHAQALRQVLAEATLADQVGVDAYGAGEHHRDDFSISAPDIVMAAIAGATERIRVGSAVTVLSSDDPVRVYERFATVDALSGGRADLIVGRGSFIESFPLFGLDLSQYEILFEEKLDLLAELLREKPVTWSGTTRPALENADVFPKTDAGLATWVGVGGTPQSAVRTAQHGMRMMLAVIGGATSRFRPFVDLYRQAADSYGTTAYPVGLHSHGHVAETTEAAKAAYFPHYKKMRDRIGRERGWPPQTRENFESEIEGGALYVGSPEDVARKMADSIKLMEAGRFDMIYTPGSLPAVDRMKHVELYGTKVIPLVREMLAEG